MLIFAAKNTRQQALCGLGNRHASSWPGAGQATNAPPYLPHYVANTTMLVFI